MLNQLLTKKKELWKIKIGHKNSLTLTGDKITQTPRVYKTSQIKEAIDNISFLEMEEKDIPEIVIKTITYVLQDFFLCMHQTGLYNRQFKFWKTLANITQANVYSLYKGILNGKNLNVYMIDLCIDPRFVSIKLLINENNEKKISFRDLKGHLDKASVYNFGKLKGIIYFINEPVLDDYFSLKLENMTNASDPISKYESILRGTKDLRFNLVHFKNEDGQYKYEHIYPSLSRGVL